MAKRKTAISNEEKAEMASFGVGIPEEDVIETSLPETYNKIEIINLISAKVKQVGSVTGQEYVWYSSGDVVEVDERDAQNLLDKVLGGRCCGNPPNKMFMIKE